MFKFKFARFCCMITLLLSATIAFALTPEDEAILNKFNETLTQPSASPLDRSTAVVDIMTACSDELIEPVLLSLQRTGQIQLINSQDHRTGHSILGRAVIANRTALVSQLLKYGADRTLANRYGATPLHLAVAENHLDQVKLLVPATFPPSPENVIYVNLQEKLDNFSALHFAVGQKNIKTLAYLMSQGADPALKDKSGQCPLDLAESMGEVKLIAEIHFNVPKTEAYQALANIMDKDNAEIIGGEDPVNDLPLGGNMQRDQLFLELVKKGSSYRSKLSDQELTDLLFYALKKADFNKFKILLEEGAVVSRKWKTSTCYGPSPLSLALQFEDSRYFDLLVDHFPAQISQNSNERFIDIFEALIDKKFNHAEKLSSLIQDDSFWEGEKFQFTLFKLVKNRNHEAVNFLVKSITDHGSSIDFNYSANPTPFQSMTALAVSVGNGDPVLTEMLLNWGANPNAVLRDREKPTALFHAVSTNNKAVISLLLKNKAQIDTLNSSGKTALTYAQEKGFKVSVQLIQNLLFNLEAYIGTLPEETKQNDYLLHIIFGLDSETRTAILNLSKNKRHPHYALWENLCRKADESQVNLEALMKIRIGAKPTLEKIERAEVHFRAISPVHPQFLDAEKRMAAFRARTSNPRTVTPAPMSVPFSLTDSKPVAAVARTEQTPAVEGLETSALRPELSIGLLKTILDESSEQIRTKMLEIESAIQFQTNPTHEEDPLLRAKLIKFADEFIDPEMDKKTTQATLRKIIKTRGIAFTLTFLNSLSTSTKNVKLRKLFISKDFELHLYPIKKPVEILPRGGAGASPR